MFAAPMLAAAVLLMQQAAPGPVVWATPVAPVVEAPAPVAPALPEAARADPYGYERAECSPYVRASSESQEDCQQRVRLALAADLGEALPAGLRPDANRCRPEPGADGFAVNCGISRAVPAAPELQARSCQTRPVALPNGGVTYEETCTNDGRRSEDGLRINLGGRD